MTLIPRIRRLIYSVNGIIPDVYMLTIRANNVLVIAEEEITLVDTGLRSTYPQIIDFINELGRSPQDIRLVILTHNHLDHSGGLAEIRRLSPAGVAIHKADILGTGSRPEPGRESRPLNLLLSGLRSIFSARLGKVDIRLSGGEILKPLGGLEVIHTPGHTPGSISLYSRKHGLVIVGDAIRNRRGKLYLPPKMASTDITQAAESIKKIAALEFDILCSGHGRPHFENAREKVQALANRS
jgi:glyoxylase-like metal-dependent hydrolase (beta-lactamase superfamily II)